MNKPLAAMTDAERASLTERIAVMIEGAIPPECVFALIITDPDSQEGQATSNVGHGTAALLRAGAAMVEGPSTKAFHRKRRN